MRKPIKWGIHRVLLVQRLINLGIKSISIISYPDYCGGRDEEMQFSSDQEEDWYKDLPDFTYVQWVGRPIDLLKEEPSLLSHKEPIHEEPYDSEWSWIEEVITFLHNQK